MQCTDSMTLCLWIHTDIGSPTDKANEMTEHNVEEAEAADFLQPPAGVEQQMKVDKLVKLLQSPSAVNCHLSN